MKAMLRITPMRLLRIPDPFDNPLWIFEPKMDSCPRMRRAIIAPNLPGSSGGR